MYKQVFQTNSKKRWESFKWTSRVLILLFPIALAIIFITLFHESLPQLPDFKAYKQAFSAKTNVLSANSKLAARYQGFRKFITQKELTNKNPYANRHIPKGFRNITSQTAPCAIRAAFYVTWNEQSFTSLQSNVNKLNLVLPEWMFIDPAADTLITAIDNRGLAVMKNAGVNIMPMLSNFSTTDKKFHGESIHRILNSKAKQEKLIAEIIAFLSKNNLQGINVDFEELQERSDENLIAFQKKIFQSLHAKGFLVTQDVIPFNEDYDYKSLAANNDFLFVMAYDEYARGTKAGPIAEQKWIEAAVDQALKKIPSEKVILGLAAYGYDWPADGGPEDVKVLTYQDAIATGKEAQAHIVFDNDTYNVHYSYADDDNTVHDVYFTDAATTFNAIRFATESEMAGVALWRLGSEDERIWNYYNKSLSKDSLTHFDFSSFAKIHTPDNVQYIGFGEVLDVLSTPGKGTILTETDSTDMLISEENYDHLPSSFIAKKFGWNGTDTTRNRKKLVLSFDDGPDPTWTPQILKILAEKHVPASFFIVGMNAEKSIPLVKRIYKEGHEIGNHTFTHPNIAEVSEQRAIIEMETTRLLLECITGHSTVLFRAPYNADFTPVKMDELLPVAIARTKNYLDVGESIDPLDWQPGISADSIVQRVITRKKQIDQDMRKETGGNIILLHDAGGNTREATVEALPRIIDYYQARGYQFTTIADLLNKTKDELMPAVPKDKDYYMMQSNLVFFQFIYFAGTILFVLFFAFIILACARIAFMAFLTWRERKREVIAPVIFPRLHAYPLVSIIVPAYNEEVSAVSSLQNLLQTDYPNFEIIFVDDGSKDATYKKVSDAFTNHQLMRIFTKPNGGKSSALNFGISLSEAEYVVCIDADTKLNPSAVSELMKHFLNEKDEMRNKIGAVAGNVKVGNEINLLTKWQAIEYITSQNFDRRAFASINAITVVPGAIGAFRKSAIEEAGGFTTDTLAEDCDLTIRLLRCGYRIKNENNALAFTEAPESLKQFHKQRFRWAFGVLQTAWKHRKLLFRKKSGWLGWFALPNILLFQYIIPFFIPLADVLMLLGLFFGNAGKILPWYIGFLMFDAVIAAIAFRMEGEKPGRLVWLLPQRLVYRWLMWQITFKAMRHALKGELQNWGVLKRSGRVTIVGMKAKA
jgi:peptidoglycan-N-acetylglucosamine deacetylase